MANRNPATPRQRLAAQYNFKLRQLKGMQAQLQNMHEGAGLNTDLDNIITMRIGYCVDDISKLSDALAEARDERLKSIKLGDKP